MIEEVRRVAEIKDHQARLRAATELMDELQAGVMETARLRRESIQWLREHGGQSFADIGRLLGVSRARIAQLRTAGPPPERAFLSSEKLRVAIPEQPEGRLVARADAAAGQRILGLAHSLGLECELEYVPPLSEIDLNRGDLFVVSGADTSPVVTAALEKDPLLKLGRLPDGQWSITERESGTIHTAPADDKEPAHTDLAYLGRLPRPDDEGSFLLIVGIRPTGAHGAAHYLAERLADIYDSVGQEFFSMVISSVHDSDTEEITSSWALTTPHRHHS
ncbi:hypothetical protein [Spirillospora albida]|uniref:hypothetical protein n=1 Tax=Spirillospora albida TaxID=58123 RepID=UPI00056C4082|nr:hypothetical protein [Spirillospora albida]